ncbi:SUMF1/EgtB/PvdO family nonheme iron enzyme [Candidatus Thiodictyon syntrophicum]|jgi:formylglycine-generating enzyme required for sulfatase activity|nr:SUMF1/EgtB/PvdO family nonheme iron enzyme [Candidatus Thiodictyon syntrophicum]
MLPRLALAADAVVTVKTDPRDAEILIDGNRQANGSPAVLHVSPGQHKLEARKPGYKPARETVFVGDGAMVVKELQLARDIPVPVPIAEQDRPETYLNPKRDAFETEPEFAARRQALIKTFNTRSAARDPAFTAGTATLVKDGYDIQTGKFPVELKLKDWSRGLADVTEPQVRLERDAARTLYQGGPNYPVFFELAPDGKLKAARLDDVPGTRLTLAPTVKTAAVKVDMVRIRAGNFLMGCQEDLCDPWEKPVHRVQIAAFDLGKYEVTFADWDACTADGGCKKIPEDRGWGRGNRPVFNISQNDVQEYLIWLARKTGQPYRLPSEAEWEYAARAGTSTRFSTGKCISTEQANYDGTWSDPSNCGANTGVNLGHTQPVGSYPANPFGLYDMHGNVCEWVEDCWNETYNGAPGDGSAWLTNRSYLGCERQVLRGGAWSGPAWANGSSIRGSSEHLTWDSLCGFRVARTLAP